MQPSPDQGSGCTGHGQDWSPSWLSQEVPKAQQLEMRLHTFSMFGMPRLPPEDRQHWEIGEGTDSGLVIEKSWKELVPGHKVGLEHSVGPCGVTDAHIYLPSALEERKALGSGVTWGKHLETSRSGFNS